MQVQNTTTGPIIISDIPGPQAGSGLTLQPGVVETIFDEDAEKSVELNSFIAAGSVVIVGANEPSTGSDVGGTPSADVTADLAANAAAAAAASAAAAVADGKAVAAQADADFATNEIAAVAVGGVIKSPRQSNGDPTAGGILPPFANSVGTAGRLKKNYITEIQGFEFEFESYEGMSPRLLGAMATGRSYGGLPYTLTRFNKAARQAMPALVSANLVNIFRATVGSTLPQTGANYIPEVDGVGNVLKSSLQVAHDDMEANGTAVLIEARGYFGPLAANVPTLDMTKNFRVVGAIGNNATSLFSAPGALITINGSSGYPAIRITKLTPGVVTLMLCNVRVLGVDAPAIELVGNVALRASNCFFDTVNSLTALPFPTIKMTTTGGAISILTDCGIHNSTPLGDLIRYEGSGGTNWISLHRGSNRNDGSGNLLNVVDGFSNFQMKNCNSEIFGSGMVVKNTPGTPITIQSSYSSAGPTKIFDTNVAVDTVEQI